MNYELHNGDCLEVMRSLPDNSVDAVVTDPPYGLSFMGKRWDYDVPSVEIWREVLRILKPGGHLLSFGGSRTHHRSTVNIEDAGFEIRDTITWLFGSGFPKSLDVSKAMDKEAGVKREIEGLRQPFGREGRAKYTAATGVDYGSFNESLGGVPVTAPATEAAKQWEGWGTALKPAAEYICLARKPLIGTVAENVKTHGTGAINIDGCRVGTDPIVSLKGLGNNSRLNDDGWKGIGTKPEPTISIGRFPANVIHDGSEEVVGLFPQKAGSFLKGDKTYNGEVNRAIYGQTGNHDTFAYGDSGSAARFFYCAKASKSDRNAGLEGFEAVETIRYSEQGQGPKAQQTPRKPVAQSNHHPTVKPTELMRYLCRLITPPNGTVLDPFAGSGSTGKAAMLEGFNFIGIEREPEYAEIAKARIEHARGGLFA